MKELIPPIIKSWEDRMATDHDKTCEAAMYHEILELRSALVEYHKAYDTTTQHLKVVMNSYYSDWLDELKIECQRAYGNKEQDYKNTIDALLLANRDLSNWFDALKTDYDVLEAENQCPREIYT